MTGKRMLHKQLTAAVGGRDFIYVRGLFGGIWWRMGAWS